MKEIVVDTNVFVSALITPTGIPRVILRKIIDGEIGLITSPRLLLEIISVFEKPKLRTLVPEQEISGLVSLIHQIARVVKPDTSINDCRDPKDNAVLECAVKGKAGAIVSGDHDLLELNPFRGIPILSPKTFLLSLNP